MKGKLAICLRLDIYLYRESSGNQAPLLIAKRKYNFYVSSGVK